MIRFTRLVVAIVLATIFSIPSGTSASATGSISYLNSVSSIAVLKKPLKTLKITDSYESNYLTASHSNPPKGQTVKYQWLRNGSAIVGETSKKYLKQVSDCGQSVRVKISLYAKGKLSGSQTSSTYKPEECVFLTPVNTSWDLLHTCGITDGSCNKYGDTGFYGFVRGSKFAQSWFKIPVPEIQPERVVRWRAFVQGYFQKYALSVTMIPSSEPTWRCCDFRGTTFPDGGLFPWISASATSISSDGFAYLGFSYYDKYGIYESLMINTIQLEVVYK